MTSDLCLSSPVEELNYMTYLFGYPIAHSWSPLLHNTLYKSAHLPWKYQLFESTSIAAFMSLLKNPKCMGSSVTMPHKIDIIPCLDELTDEGREVGACNTIFIRMGSGSERRYIGTNTDVIGIREAFAQNVPGVYEKCRNCPAMVIGGGGAARSAIYALNKWFGVSAVYLVNRDEAEIKAVIASCQASGFGDNLVHVRTVQEANQLAGPLIAVGCVPDFPPVTSAELEARQVAELLLSKACRRGIILEMAYHPKLWTGLAGIAQAAGWEVILGTEAVIWQGIEQHRLWTGRRLEDVPVRLCKETFAKALSEASQVPKAGADSKL